VQAAVGDVPGSDESPEDAQAWAQMVENLRAIGFGEEDVEMCLQAAGGDPDLAFEYLTNGIPPPEELAQQQRHIEQMNQITEQLMRTPAGLEDIIRQEEQACSSPTKNIVQLLPSATTKQATLLYCN
jgi:hypothetical protein